MDGLNFSRFAKFALAWGCRGGLRLFLARRWQVESAFGKIADPLADRLMIGTAVVTYPAPDVK